MGEAVPSVATEYQPVQGDELTAEQRAAARYMPLIRTAKLVFPSGEFLCVVRDASASGVSVRLFHPVPPDTCVTLELQNGDRHELERVWDRGERQGYQFAGEVDLERLLAARGEHPKRPIRLNLPFEAELKWLGGREMVKVQNLSQQGANLECGRLLAIDQRVRLSCRHLPEVRATVRWRHVHAYGIVFEDTFQFAELARIAARVQGVENFYSGS